MAVSVLTKVFDGFPGGGSEYLAMIVLADWSNDEGRCFPSMTSIAKKTRLSRSQAQRVVHSLIELGFVKVTGNKFGGPPGATRHYQISLDKLTGSIGATGRTDATGSAHAQDGSHGCAETGSTHATQTTIYPSLTVNRHFAEFWKAYPKRKNKGDAEKAFKALKVNDELLEKMLSAITLAKQSQEWQKDGGQFIQHPASWLRARGWEDEYQTTESDKRGLVL